MSKSLTSILIRNQSSRIFMIIWRFTMPILMDF